MKRKTWITFAATAAMTWSVGTALAQSARPELMAPTVDPGTPRVVNGVRADIAEHPWQVGLLIWRPDDKAVLCGGSVIAPRWVLTAAHCFSSSVDNRRAEVRVGSAKLFEGADVVGVERTILHPDFDRENYRNDIALVKLRADLGERIIPMASPEDEIPLGTMLEVTGWGATGEGEPSSTVLLAASVPLVANEECNAFEAYAGRVAPGMLCAGHREGGTDSCQGDSGGPLVWRGPQGPILAGVVSWGEGCARALRYGVYTRIAVHRNWINDIIVTA